MDSGRKILWDSKSIWYINFLKEINGMKINKISIKKNHHNSNIFIIIVVTLTLGLCLNVECKGP
jgi:hypothetical protein